MSLRHALAPVALLAACDASSIPPAPRPAGSASSAIASSAEPPARGSSDAPARAPAATAAPAPADASPTCRKGPAHYGGWTPSASDVVALVAHMRGVDCGDPDLRRSALERCMKEQGQSSVTVQFEGVVQPGNRPFECSLGVTGAEWRGRRFLVVRDSYFQVPTAWGYTNVYELKRGEPVLYLDGVEKHAPLCQGPSPAPNAAKPPGWSTFPKDLQEVLCGR